MTDIEMSYLNPAPCIDLALAQVSATMGSLGIGEPTIGECLRSEFGFLQTTSNEISIKVSGLSGLGGGNEAWLVTFTPRFSVLTRCVQELARIIECERETIANQAGYVRIGRDSLELIIADLNNQRNLVLVALPTDPIEAHIIDVNAAAAAMEKHNQLVVELKKWTGESVNAMKLLCGSLNECGEPVSTQSGGIESTAVDAALGSVSMPIDQLLQAQRDLLEYAKALATVDSFGPAVVTDVQATHGRFFDDDFIPVLSEFSGQHNVLLAALRKQVRLMATGLGDSAGGYLSTDAQAACLVTDRLFG